MEPWRTPAHGCCGCCCCSRPTGTGRRRSSRTAWRSAPGQLRFAHQARRRERPGWSSPTGSLCGAAVVPRRLGCRAARLVELPRGPDDGSGPTGVRFRQRELPGGDAAAFVQSGFAAIPTRYQVLATIHALRRGSWGSGARRADRHRLVPAAQECRLARLASDDPRRRGRGVRDRRTAGARRAPPRTGRRFTRAGNSSAVFG